MTAIACLLIGMVLGALLALIPWRRAHERHMAELRALDEALLAPEYPYLSPEREHFVFSSFQTPPTAPRLGPTPLAPRHHGKPKGPLP